MATHYLPVSTVRTAVRSAILITVVDYRGVEKLGVVRANAPRWRGTVQRWTGR